VSTSKLQSTVSHYRTQLASNETKATTVLNQAHAHTVKVIQPHLDTLYQQIGDAQASGEPVPPHFLYEQNRLAATKAMISRNINQYGALARTQVGQLVATGAQLGVKSSMTQLADSRPPGVNFSFGVPSKDAIENIVGATSEGSPLADLFAGFGEEAADEAAKALITGLTLGDNPREIAPLVEDALDISRQRALTIARTEMQRAYRDAAMETYRANDDVVGSWVWVADLSPRTCFPAETMIETKYGPIAINQVHIGDEVLTHTGEYKPVAATSERPWIGRFIGIRTKEGDVWSTSEHPFLVERQGKLDWIEARNLQLGDRVFYQNQCGAQVIDHDIGDRPVEGSISQSDHTIASRLKPECFSLISFFNTGLRMPVHTINLKASIERWKKEIDRIAPSWKRMLLLVFNSQRLKTKTCISLWTCLTCMLAIASHRAKASSNRFSGRCSKLLTTIGTGIDNWWSSTFLRAMLMPWSVLIENFPATFTGSIGHFRLLTVLGAIDTTILTRHNGKGFVANRTDLNNVGMGFSAFQGTKILRLRMWQCKRFATIFANPLCSWSCNFAFSRMRMLSLVKRIANSRAEAPSALPNPSIRDGEGYIALDTNHFHSTIITQIDIHIQDLLVYNLEVRDDHSYVANGFVVHNCAACIALNGTEHPLSEDLDGHPNCRCSKSPKTKSWEDILGPLGIDTSGIEETSLEVQSGKDWFDAQSEETQREILGNKKYEAYANGDFELEDIVGHAHSEDWGDSVYEKSLDEIIKGGGEEESEDDATAAKPPKRINLEPIEEPEPSSEESSASKIVDELSEKYPNTTFDLSGVDDAFAPKIAEQIKTLYEDYPEVGESIGYIGTGEGVDYDPHWDRQYVAVTVDDYEGASSIFLNPTFFGSEEAMALMFDQVDTGWFAADSSVESLISHEFGHSIDYYLRQQVDMSTLGFIDDFSGNGSVARALDDFMLMNEQDGRSVSGYAKAGGVLEAWAEAFSTLYNGNPGPYAKQQQVLLDQLLPASKWQNVSPSDLTPIQAQAWQAFTRQYILVRD
jgi:hypothetical protein